MILPSHYVEWVELKEIPPGAGKSYPFNIPGIKRLGRLEFHPAVTFFVGENGSGKSTLLEALALAVGFGPEGGTRNVQVATADTVSPLRAFLRVSKGVQKPKDGYFLRAESFYNVATYMDQTGYLQAYGGKSLHAQSHGESFLALLTKKLSGHGIYLLDEPEAALSPRRQLAALVAIDNLVARRSQFIIATHSPILLAYPNARIIKFDEHGLHETSYEETEHYQVTKDFIIDYKRQLNHLLRGDG